MCLLIYEHFVSVPTRKLGKWPRYCDIKRGRGKTLIERYASFKSIAQQGTCIIQLGSDNDTFLNVIGIVNTFLKNIFHFVVSYKIIYHLSFF